MTYDVESLLCDVKKLLVKHLNNAIAEVEQEKVSLGFPATDLQPIDPDTGYFEQSWADNSLNVTPAIFYGVMKLDPVSISAATEEKITIFVSVILVDPGQDALCKTRIHRYNRALKQVFEKHYGSFPFTSKINIETFLPVAFKFDEDSSEEMKIGGVALTTSIA